MISNNKAIVKILGGLRLRHPPLSNPKTLVPVRANDVGIKLVPKRLSKG